MEIYNSITKERFEQIEPNTDIEIFCIHQRTYFTLKKDKIFLVRNNINEPNFYPVNFTGISDLDFKRYFFKFEKDFYILNRLSVSGLVSSEQIIDANNKVLKYYKKDTLVFSEILEKYFISKHKLKLAEIEYIKKNHNVTDSLDSYHSTGDNFRIKNFKNKSIFTIGYEIEKEDRLQRNRIDIHKFKLFCPLWKKERDGSLTRNGGLDGYELISPVFELDIKEIFKEIENNILLKDAINADHSANCGGHINIGGKGLSGVQIFDLICGYMPLIYAMYPKRLNNSYSIIKSNDELKRNRDKYQSVCIKNNRIEIRVFSAVINVENLRFRTELIDLMLKNPTNNLERAYFNVFTKFEKLLGTVYNTVYKFNKLKERYNNLALQFEGVDLVKIEKHLEVIKNNKKK